MNNKRWLVLWWLVLQLCGAAPAAAADIYPSPDPAHALSLNGQWSFKYLPTLDAGADVGFTSPAVDVAHWGTIAVPSNWELQGHAEPSYADTLKDGLGLYRRSFSVPAHWNGRRTFLRFDGVAFGYEVWVNGKQAGASSASAFNRHTFDVTDLLQDGANVLAVRVSTKPLGYEFDLNDDWSLSGIYRDVTLLSLPALHVQDIDSTTTVRSNGSAALALTVQLSQPAGEVRAQLFDPSGKRVADALLAPSAQHRTATLELAQPRLWTAETPSLYRLVLSVSQHGKTVHTVEQRIGLRQVSVDGKRLLVNGKPIKLRGVNHHDLDPVTGRAVTEAQIRQDLALMKKGNVNYVRTAHYPPHPRLLELCDELGFYVMDEVAIGHGEKHLDDPAYRDNILARARATVARDKHHASVIIWSIGNENPISEVEFEAGRLVKQLDPTRPITYPKIGSYFAKNYERIPPFVDLYSPHYPSNATLAGYADKLTRPTILTEYAHALGLATDRMQDQWAMLQANPVFAGGSLWHFHDQGLLRRSQTPVDTTKPTQLVWRDAYQYYDTNGLDGSDGLVYADRTPQVDFWQMRKVYAPVQFLERSAPVQTGRQKLAVTLENRYDFRSLAGVTLHWVLEHNGKAVQQGKTALSTPAHQRQTVNIAVDIPAQRTAYADVLALRLSAVDRDGLQINERTLRLLRPGAGVAGFDWTRALPVQAAPVVRDTAEQIEVRLAQWILTVQRSSGALEIRDRNGRVLVAGIQPHSGRRLTMAEALGAAKSGVWQVSVLDQITSPVITAVSHANGVRVSVRGTYKLPQAEQTNSGKSATAAPDDLIPTGDGKPAATHVQGLSGGYQLDINRQGAITVSYDYRPLGAGVVAEAGLSLVAPAGMEEFRWIGQGPYAGYPGKDQLNEFGLHHLNRADLHFQGNRRGTTLAVLTDGGGAGMALATLPADVAVERHGSATLLSHNALIGGLGNKGTQPETIVELDPQRQINGSFTLLPVAMDGHGRWPAALVGWFGQPTPACDVYQPFFHSYDQ